MNKIIAFLALLIVGFVVWVMIPASKTETKTEEITKTTANVAEPAAEIKVEPVKDNSAELARIEAEKAEVAREEANIEKRKKQAELKKLKTIGKKLKKYGPDKVKYKKTYTAQALKLKDQIRNLTEKVLLQKKTVKKLERKYNRALNGLKKRWKTSDRIGWRYKDSSVINEMSTIKSRNRKRGIVYIYPDKDKRAQEEAAKVKPSLDQAKQALTELETEKEGIQKEYNALWDKVYKEVRKEYSALKKELKEDDKTQS